MASEGPGVRSASRNMHRIRDAPLGGSGISRPQDIHSARDSWSLSISDNSVHTSTRYPLEQGAPKGVSEANPGTPTLPTSQRQRMLR